MSQMIRASLAALLGMSVSAAAADALPGSADGVSEPAAFSPSPGWYLLGSLSYVVSKPTYDFDLNGEQSQTRRFGYAVGSGYRFNSTLRADLTMSYVNSDWYVEGGTTTVTGRHKIWSTLVNGYVDLAAYGKFTPYVGAGAGLLRTMDTMRLSLPGSTPQLDSTQTEFAYSLNGGVGYHMSDSLTLDLGYQFLASPKTSYLDFDTLTIDRGVQLHQVKIGLRYSLQ